MNRRIASVVIASLLILLLVVVGIAGAQTSAAFDLSWHALTNGSDAVASDDFLMNGTLGQGMVGASYGHGSRVTSGYWSAMIEPRHQTYLPLVLRQ